MRLNLGCADDLRPGYTNVDRIPVAMPLPEGVAFRQLDLSGEWPWRDSSVDHVLAHDIIEHMLDKIHMMNELWRVLGAGARAEIVVPTTGGTGAWQDPTHVSYWNRRSFCYYEAGNPYRERFARSYGIRAAFRIVSASEEMTQDGPKLTIVLEAVK